MAKSAQTSNGENNRLLKSLPHEDYRRLSPHFELIPLTVRQVMYEQDKPIDHIYFPQTGVLSLLITLKDGTKVEAATVGNEGLVGIGVLLDSIHVHLQTICQVPGAAIRMKASVFKKEMEHNPFVRRLLHRYTESLMIQFTQGVACNRLHAVEKRCARWLLTTHDRVDSDIFQLTQEFLGQMLGVRRASVTVVAGMLQNAGLIQYSRGVIRILDRKGLEQQSCECYEGIRHEVDRLTKP